MYSEIISYWDWLLSPFYLLIIFIVASNIQARNKRKNLIYKYFLWGLFAKIFGAISLCLIYLFYYKTGGDTLNYHTTAKALVNLFYYNSGEFFEVLFGKTNIEHYSYFTYETGYPTYWNDYHAFNVARLIVFLEIIGFKSYLVSSILMAVVSFTGIWKLYTLFCELFPSLYKQFAISILFLPSVIFWGSGILKDSWTLAATGWFCYSFYHILIARKKIIFNSITIIISSVILICIKPYIFVALMPGCLIWGMWSRIMKIENLIFKFLFVPVIFIFGVGGGVILWGAVSSRLEDYSSLDTMIKKASMTSDDLKQDYYQGNSFDIGVFDPSARGMISKFPIATIAGLFRPYLWEVRNVVMLASGLENILILFFTLYVFLRKPFVAFSSLFSNPLVLFSLIFAVFFAFSVAISTSNFGALVRLRIPMLPFFISGLMIIEYLKQTENPALPKLQRAN